jgi:hypothetical protein
MRPDTVNTDQELRQYIAHPDTKEIWVAGHTGGLAFLYSADNEDDCIGVIDDSTRGWPFVLCSLIIPFGHSLDLAFVS